VCVNEGIRVAWCGVEAEKERERERKGGVKANERTNGQKITRSSHPAVLSQSILQTIRGRCIGKESDNLCRGNSTWHRCLLTRGASRGADAAAAAAALARAAFVGSFLEVESFFPLAVFATFVGGASSVVVLAAALRLGGIAVLLFSRAVFSVRAVTGAGHAVVRDDSTGEEKRRGWV